MLTDPSSLVFILVGFGLTFVVARILGNRWTARRRKRAEQAALAGESRQVRRARERKQRER
jgi:hypothetical protein